MTWEKKNKEDILAWRNGKLMLEPDSEDRDLCNVEMLRPQTSVMGMHSATIPGRLFFGTHPTPEYLAGWERTFGKKDPEDIQADFERLAAENAELREKAVASGAGAGSA